MTDETRPDHHPDHRPDAAAAPPPSTPPTTTPPAATNPPATPPPFAAATAPIPTGSIKRGTPIRGRVAAIGLVALFAVIVVIVWGGGDRGSIAATGPSGGGDSYGTSTGNGAATDSPIATERTTEAPASTTGAEPTFEAAPLDPAQIAPAALLAADPQLSAPHEWLLPGRVDTVTQRYLDLFPQPGYEMKGGLGADHPSGQTTYVYTVGLTDGSSSAPVGTMYFMADPADPQGQTRVGLKIGR